MPFEPQVRAQIAQATAHLYALGHNAPVDGNISVRLGERYLMCTPSQMHKGQLAARDVVKVRLRDGQAVDTRQRPSSEIRMHLAIYRLRSDVGAIVHAHSPYTTALTVAGKSLRDPVIPETILALGHVPTVPYASPTTTEVPAAVCDIAAEHDAFVLERHGPVALGKTIEQAMTRLEIVEHTAKITWMAEALGPTTPIDPTEHAKLRLLAANL